MKKIKKFNKKIFIILSILFVLLIIFFCIFFNRDSGITLFDSMKKITSFYHEESSLICKNMRCDIGKIKLDGKNVSLSYSNEGDNYSLIMDDKTIYFYKLDDIIYIKSISSKYILIKKKEVINLEDGTSEEVVNYDFIDNNGNLLSSDELVNIDLSEVD